MCSSSVTSGWNTDSRAMEWLVSRDIESDIAFLRQWLGGGIDSKQPWRISVVERNPERYGVCERTKTTTSSKSNFPRLSPSPRFSYFRYGMRFCR